MLKTCNKVQILNIHGNIYSLNDQINENLEDTTARFSIKNPN